MVNIIGSTGAFSPVKLARMNELLMVQNTTHEVFNEWSKKHGPKPLSNSLWASKDYKRTPNGSESSDSDESTGNRPNGVTPPESSGTQQRNQSFESENAGTHRSTFNPEAWPFAPVPPVSCTMPIGSPEEFMNQWQALEKQKSGANAAPAPAPAPAPASRPRRRIVFSDIPEWANISDMLCLIHGGGIERIWSEGEGQIVVQFLDENACSSYYNAYANGIRLGDHIIKVEQAECDPVPQRLQDMIDAGNSRVVCVDAAPNKFIEQLVEVAVGFQTDHIQYHFEPNKPGRAYYFLCSIHDGQSLMQKLQGPGWRGYAAEFLPDPCGVAQGFHSNTVPASRMLSAVAN